MDEVSKINNTYELSAYNMKVIEMSKADIHGRIRVKFALHEVFDDTSGTNENGINWLREYVEKNMHTVEGMSLKVHFGNDEKTIATGHGFLETEDGEPRFESEIIGNFNSANAKIEKVNSSKGEVNALTAWATIDSFMYNNFTSYLQNEMKNGNTVESSIEIMSTKKGEPIKYLNGWNAENRTPVSYVYGGHAILGIRPADEVSVMLEVAEAKKIQTPNNSDFNELKQKINELDIKTKKKKRRSSEINNKEEIKLDEKIMAVLEEIKSSIAELNSSKEKATEINDLKSALDESNATVAQLKETLANLQTERDKLCNDLEILSEKQEELIKAIADKELENQVMALNSAIAKEGFTEDDLKVAEDLVTKFKADPKSVEVSSIVNAIKADKYSELSKELAEKEKEVTHEVNSFRVPSNLGDIFGSVENFSGASTESGSLF